MKNEPRLIYLFFLLLILALVFTAAHLARKDETTTTPTPWLPPRVTPDPIAPTSTPGWWDELPTPVPFPTPSQRK